MHIQEKGIELPVNYKIPFWGNMYYIYSTELNEKGRREFTLYIIVGRTLYVTRGFHFSDKENMEILDELNEGMEDFIYEQRRKQAAARRELSEIILF